MVARRPHLLLLLVLASFAALAKGHGKMIDLRTVPKTIPNVSDALAKEKKDPNKRAAYALTLDDMLRSKPEADSRLYDELAGALINDVLDKMCEPTEVFATEVDPDKWNPRAEVFFKTDVRVYPGRVSGEFRRKYTKKPMGKNIDRGYRGQPATFDFQVAANEPEFTRWTDAKGWGVVIHEARFDSGVARIGLTWVSGGTKDKPGGHVEHPAWVAFYKQPKPGVGSFQLLSIEPETAVDWREQPINMVPAKTEPNELERKLHLSVWMEDVRALPVRLAFLGDEEKIFNLDGEGDDKLEAAQLSWLEPYREHTSPMVRAAAELKIARLGGQWKPDNIETVLKFITHAAVKAKLEEQKKQPPPAAPELDAGIAAGKDAGK